MEYIYNVSVVCGLIKTLIFSQEIFHKECIPAGSHEENDILPATQLKLRAQGAE